MVAPSTWAMVSATKQLSLLVGAPKVTVVVQLPVPSLEVVSFMSAGQEMVGSSSSFTVTVKEQLSIFPASSSAIILTHVVPRLNARALRVVSPEAVVAVYKL